MRRAVRLQPGTIRALSAEPARDRGELSEPRTQQILYPAHLDFATDAAPTACHMASMSDERYSSMDEGTLRTLLEATQDLAERRQIRTAIRELRRKELEGYEEALATKRFRSEKSSEHQENKENCPRSQEIEEDQTKTRTILLGELEAIKDVDKLTTLLRTANEYEERKLIRAAIRKLRNEEIEAISLLVGRSRECENGKLASREQEIQTGVSTSVMPERDDLEERHQIRAQIRELRTAQNQEAKNSASKELASGMLLLDTPSKQLSSSTSKPMTSENSDLCLSRSTSLALEDAMNDIVQKSLNSPLQKKSQDYFLGLEDGGRARTEGSSVINPEETRCIGAMKKDNESVQICTGSTTPNNNLRQTTECVQTKPDPHSTNQSSKFSIGDKSQISTTPSMEKTATVAHTRDHPADVSPFRRANSLRDSAKRFTEESVHQPTLLKNRFSSQRGESRGSRILQQQQQLLQSASPALRNRDSPTLTNTREWTPGRQMLDSPLKKRQEITFNKGSEDKAADDTPNSKSSLRRELHGLLVQPRVKEHQKLCLNETDGASHSKPGSIAISTQEQRLRSDSVKGAFIADTGGKSNLSTKEGVKSSTIHQQTSEGEAPIGRSKASQSESTPVTSHRRHIENTERNWKASEDPSTQCPASLSSLPANHLDSHTSNDRPAAGPGKGPKTTSEEKLTESEAIASDPDQESNMKTLLTIEIKDGRNQPASSRIIGTPGSQRAELTLGLRASPFTVTTSRGSSNVVKVETEKTEQQKPAELLPNGVEKTQEKEPEKKSKLNVEELSRIEEEEVLDKMLDKTTDFEERRLIRSAMRELRQKKRDQREKERDQRLQELKIKNTEGKTLKGARSMEATMSQSEKSADGSSVSTVTKTQRLVQSNDGNKTSRTTTMESTYMKRSEDGGTIVQTKASFSSTSKKVGSIFDREDDAASRASNLAALERRQAERKKELMKAQSLPKTSSTQARKAMIDKLESGSPSSPAISKVAIPHSSGFGVPNANSIKQMLLDWCKAKTRGYENVNIQNFSSSWSDGMAFCALVHNFFPEAFDYNQLSPQNRRKNFDLAFSTAEKHADCPQLLDVEDMVRMREPDWKCVYTYIQEFYRCLVQKGLVKTKQS